MPQTAASLESNVRLPRAVRERSERIRAMTEAPALPPADPPTPPAEAPAIEAPGPSPTPEPPPTPPADPRESDPQYWAQRFRVTQGMLERERRERVAEQERTGQTTSELREQLRTAQQQPATPSKIDISAFFTPEQIEQYGAEQCETLAHVAVKAAREQTQSAIATAMQPINEARERDAQQTAREKQQAFVSALADLVPDFEAVDAGDGWKQWLAQEDEASGYVRQALLDSYVRDGRADRTAKLFNAYKATLGARPVPPVAPSGRAGAPAAPQPAAVPALGYPSPAQIREHYKRAAIGKVTDKERSEFEARLQLPRPAA